LISLGFTVVLADPRYGKVPAGHVLTVQPGAGAERERGTRITIVPSLGPPPVDVPAVKDALLADAREAIRAAGLRVETVRRRYDARVEADHVIAVRPATDELPRGSEITLVVSDGPKPLPIPDVRGMAEEDATKALDAKGFSVVIEEAFSRNIDRGHVVGTDPKPGTVLQPGQTIAVTVSLGPEYFACPGFVGMSVDEANALAARYGLKLTALEVPGSGGNDVVSQLPEAGTRVRYGSTVTVYYA
jgi:serine/threonine-protein kinase